MNETYAVLVPGTYVFEVATDADSATATCVYAGPSTPCECSFQWGCGADRCGPVVEPNGQCTATAGLFIALSFHNPRSITVRGLKDGVEFASRDAMPEYHTFMPNGAGCTPTCRQAQPMTIVL